VNRCTHRYTVTPWPTQQRLVEVGTDSERGETLIGVAGFSVPDDLDSVGGYRLCAPTKDHPLVSPTSPAFPLKAPAAAS
jgi:hypothetical protein